LSKNRPIRSPSRDHWETIGFLYYISLRSIEVAMKKYSLIAFLFCFWVSPAMGQQVDEEVVQEGTQVQSRMIIASDDGSGEIPQVTFMSSDGGGMGQLFMSDVSTGFSMGAPDVFSLAQNGDVQKEIELVDDQLEQLKKINSDFSKRIQEKMAEMKDDKGNFDIAKARSLSAMMKELNEEKQAKMQDVFLPHQFERLRQISLQTQMRRSGETNMLANKEVVEALGLSDEQLKKLKEKAKELKAEMDEEIKQLKEKARKSLFKELTSDQRDKLKSMLGNDFELKQTNVLERIRKRRSQSDTKPESEDR